ncbi:MAG: SMP-30/gluconolactonase/LRE family protein [Mariniphaga sp.]|nr:SMP-30/gluconolactonase/LRE family protein [Mariniphaga sp.]
MINKGKILFPIFLTILLLNSLNILFANEGSVYTMRPDDSEAYYFTPENYNIKADGILDITDELQAAINQVKKEKGFGILFIPEGKYKISKTIYVPTAIRLIGYGENRPEIILAKNSPGYQQEVETDKGLANYMIWFTGSIVAEGTKPRDAGAGTFYSGIMNIDLRIEDGNPFAVALRTHFAQHSMVNHVNIYIGEGKAGLFDVGNEMENVKFYGGEYGIYTTTTSPGWPMMLVDTYFENQRKAAILTNNAGLTILNMHAKNVPVVVEIEKNRFERLYMENCFFENIKEAGIIVSLKGSSMNQVNLLNIDCKDVSVLVNFRQTGEEVEIENRLSRVNEYTFGLVMEDMVSDSNFESVIDIEPIKEFASSGNSIPSFPSMDKWVNIRDFGAKGDGETDDTKVFQEAIEKYKNIYVPQGWYRFTETVKMEQGTKLIGLHPFGTQFILQESEPAFSGFGGPKPLIESSEGGDDILNGIGLNTGAYNYRAVACKWMAGENSLFNDIKFVGGHGTMRRPLSATVGQTASNRRSQGNNVSSPANPVTERGVDRAWDTQFWSLWITNNGGGTFKNIWTASTYATNGLYVSNTSTPGRILAISLEHHIKNEARFNNVSNWKIYAFQLEEESREGKDCQMVELSDCSNIMFANLYIFRVIRVSTPQTYGVRLWNCESIEFRNIHTFAQVKYVITYPVYDVNKEIKVLPWQLAKLNITGKETGNINFSNEINKIEKLVSGFEFAEGITSDSKGNVYFCEHRLGRIYKWSVQTNSLSLIADYHWKPFALATDTKDNLLVTFRYDPQPGYLIDGKQETFPRLPDDNNGFSSWGNSGWAAWAYSINPNNPDETFKAMPRVPTGEIKTISKAIYPSGRWRHQIGWGYDFDKAVVWMPETSFVAPDGVTIIPETYDLGRSAALSDAIPGQPFYVADETLKRVVKLDVAENGKLSGLQQFSSRGEFSTTVDSNGNVYIADGLIFVYDKNGNETGRINLPERPIAIVIGGKNKNTLFATTQNSLYSVRIK